MDLLFPPWMRVSNAQWTPVASAAAARSIFTGATRTLARSGDRLRLSFNVENAKNLTVAERSVLARIRKHLRGAGNRIYVPIPGYTQRGSFPSTELLTNNDFSNGTTGWAAQQSTLSVADRALRFKPTRGGVNPGFLQNPTMAQYVPYAARAIAAQQSGRGSSISIQLSDSVVAVTASVKQTLGTASLVSMISGSTGNVYPAYIGDSTFDVNDAVDAYWSSLSRCMLVDNGPNALTYSDQFDNAAWTKSGVTVTANGNTAPDGTSTADYLNEDSSTGSHYLVQTGPSVSVAADYCGMVMARRQNMARDIQIIVGTTGSGHYGYCTFDLGAGTVGTASLGGSATNARAFTVAMGDAWYACYLVVRLPTAATRADLQLMMSSAGATSYTGGSGGTMGILRIWRGGVAQSSVPTRGASTTSTAVASGTPQTGAGLYVKGLPVSSIGLLLEDDIGQIGNQLCTGTGSLDSDSAGLGYLPLAYGPRTAPADNAPVIVNTPMMRAISVDDGGWADKPGAFADHSFTFEEALDVA